MISIRGLNSAGLQHLGERELDVVAGGEAAPAASATETAPQATPVASRDWWDTAGAIGILTVATGDGELLRSFARISAP